MCGLRITTDPFTFTFTDSANNDDVLVTSEDAHFYMSDKYLQLDLTLPSQRIFGLGERQHEFSIKEGTWTMWSNSDVPSYDIGNGGKSGKGVHPFALVQTKNPGVYFGIYFRNSNAQSPIVQYKDEGKSVLSFISTGGNIEMYFFWKGTAKQIIQQYQNFIGKPNLPPFWSLGWHAGSLNYATLGDLQAMIKGYSDEGMPLEAIWLNNYVYQAGANFKIDTNKYPALSSFRTTLDATNQKLVLTVNTGLDATNIGDDYIIQGQAG
jgi:alpha-glucosidase